MGAAGGPNITNQNLVAYFDVTNEKCIDATQTIDANTRLNNLAGGDPIMYPYDSYANMSFVQENGNYVYNQNGVNGGDPGWLSTVSIARSDSYSFVAWFKFTYGTGNQRAENIYGGGFQSETSFVISWGGTSSSHGVLRYSDAGGTNSYSDANAYGGNDNNWHMFASTDEGGDGNQNTKFYIDGILKGNSTSNGSHDTPDGSARMTWGSWSGGYGNYNGRTNCYMYYDRVLSAQEIVDLYNATKNRFQ